MVVVVVMNQSKSLTIWQLALDSRQKTGTSMKNLKSIQFEPEIGDFQPGQHPLGELPVWVAGSQQLAAQAGKADGAAHLREAAWLRDCFNFFRLLPLFASCQFYALTHIRSFCEQARSSAWLRMQF